LTHVGDVGQDKRLAHEYARIPAEHVVQLRMAGIRGGAARTVFIIKWSLADQPRRIIKGDRPPGRGVWGRSL